MVNDPKWRTIANRSEQKIGDVVAVYMHMLTCASNATERGRTEGWNDEDVGTALDLKIEQVAAIRDAMQGRVLEGDCLAGWAKRQPVKEDETAAARAKAWREAEKIKALEDEIKRLRTEANGSERKVTLDTDKSREDKKGKSKAEAEAPPALPDWMPLDSWAGYLEMRKKTKKAPTDRAVVLLIASLGKMRDDGQDIAAVLDKSTKSNWTDVYPIREGQQARAGPGTPDKFDPTAYVNRNRNKP